MSSLHQDAGPPPGSVSEGGAQKWLTLLCVAVGTLVTTLEGGVTNIMPPALVDAFSSDISTMLWFAVVYLVTSTGLFLTVGWLGDTLGRRRMYLAGYVVFTLGLGLVAVSQNLVQLFVFRIIQAIGSSLLLSNSNALVAAAFPARERGKALGINNGMVGVGTSLGPLLGSLLLQYMDWRAAYWVRLPLGVIGLLMAIRFLREQTSLSRGPIRVDYPGIVLLYGTITAFLLAVNQAGRRGLDAPVVWGLALATLVLLPLLLARERRATNPVIDLALFRSRPFAVSQASVFIHFVALGALSFLVPFYLLGGLGVSFTLMGVMVATLAGVRIVLGPVAGLLYDRVGARIPTVGGMAVMAGGLLLLSGLAGAAQVWLLVVLFIVIGVGTALFDAANTSDIMGMVPRERLGSASASIPTFRQTGRSTGIALGGAIFATRELAHARSLGGSSNVAAQSTMAAFGDAALVMAALAALGAVVTWFRGRT